MAARRGRIDRRFPVDKPTMADRETGEFVVFHDGWGAVTGRYDLDTLDLPQDIAQLLADAFRHHHAALSHNSQRHCWMALRMFARFAAEDRQVLSVNDLSSGMVGRYIAWLDRQSAGTTKQPWSKGTRANVLMQLRQMIDWTKRRHPSRLPARIDFPGRVWPNRNASPRPQLSSDELNIILRACNEDIDEAWARFETGRRILSSSGNPEGIKPELCRCVRALAQVEQGVLPSRRQALLHKVNMSAIDRLGGLRYLGSYLHLTGETVVAYFIAVAIQTAGNPDALRKITRDCLVAHPLDEHRTLVEWAKPRAGNLLKKLQRRSFDRRRRHAVPNLIEQLLAMTAPLVVHSGPQDRNRLFLVKSEKKGMAGLIAESTLSHAIPDFIHRANARIAIWNQAAPDRVREFSPDFSAMMLRGSVATAYYAASGGDITMTQSMLNHARIDTTERYIKGPQAHRVQQEIIARLQGLMIGWVIGKKTGDERQEERDLVTLTSGASVLFSHNCLNPVAGLAPGTREGTVCRYFGGCLRCPGLVIPVDAEHMARILQAIDALEHARERIDPSRFARLYAPSLGILVDDILPDFPVSLRGEAEQLMQTLPALPELE